MRTGLTARDAFPPALYFLVLALLGGAFVYYLIVSLGSMEDGRDYNGHTMSWDLEQHRVAAEAYATPGGLRAARYVYPPLIAWTSRAFADWAPMTAAWAWMAASLVFYGAALAVLVRGWNLGSTAGAALLFFTHPAFVHILRGGQNSCLSLLIIVLSVWCWKTRRPVIAGCVAACLFYKPQLAAMMGLVFLLCGSWRAAFATGAASAGWLLLGLLLCGIDRHLEWLDAVRQVYRLPLTVAWQGAAQALERITDSSAWRILPLLAAAALGTIAWRAFRRPNLPEESVHLRPFLVLPACALSLPYFVNYELVFFLPMMVWFQHLVFQTQKWGLLVLALVPQVVMALSFSAWDHRLPLAAVPLSAWFIAVLWLGLRLDRSPPAPSRREIS